MAYPVVSRTRSASARRTSVAPRCARTRSTSTRDAPSISTSTGTPSAVKIRDLTIWPSSQPTAVAACAAVRVASGKARTGTWRPSAVSASAKRG